MTQLQPLTPQEEKELRTLAIAAATDTEGSDRETKLALQTLRLLATVERLRRAADPMAQRFTTGCPFPELVTEGLGHLWRQPNPGEHRYNTWQPQLVTAVKRWLKKQDRPCGNGEAINAIHNKVFSKDWGWLVQRWQEGQPTTPVVAERSRSHTAAPFGVPVDGGLNYWQQVQNRQPPQNRP
jgi:hypothetical protein